MIVSVGYSSELMNHGSFSCARYLEESKTLIWSTTLKKKGLLLLASSSHLDQLCLNDTLSHE